MLKSDYELNSKKKHLFFFFFNYLSEGERVKMRLLGWSTKTFYLVLTFIILFKEILQKSISEKKQLNKQTTITKTP